MKHERCITNGHTPVATSDADCSHVVHQPILRLNCSVVLGSVSGKDESLGKLLPLNAWPKTCRAGWPFLFLLEISRQLLDAMTSIVVPDHTRPQALADRGNCSCQPFLAPAADYRLFYPAVRRRRVPTAVRAVSVQ